VALRVVKWVLGLLVLAAVGRQVYRTWEELRSHPEEWRLEAGWLVLSGLSYVVGLGVTGVYFWRVLGRSETPVGLYEALRAYLIGHLGKYVPGKALTVVIRAGLASRSGARPATAAFSTLYETFVMMGTGSLLAGLLFWGWGGSGLSVAMGSGRKVEVALWLAGLALAVPFFVVSSPGVFSRVSGVVRTPFPGVGLDALPRLTWGLLGEGLLWTGLGWMLLGLSQVLVVRALGSDWPPVGGWATITASVALATVAGFVVLLFPGGLVVREGVLMVALGPLLGSERAVVSALLLRLVWVVSELVLSLVLWFVRPRGATGSAEVVRS
jgi:hypothetical protein